MTLLTKQRIFKVLETAVQVFENRRRTIPTSQLNSYMLEQVAITPAIIADLFDFYDLDIISLA